MTAPDQKPASSHRGWLVLAFLLTAFVAFVAASSHQLPERVATHFDLHGKPNGWMARSQHVNLTIAVGILTPLFVVGIFALIGRMKGWGLNIPHKAYWLAPEREAGTFAFLRRHGLWLAALVVFFHAGIFEAIVIANARTPAFLSPGPMNWLTGGFLALTGIWVAVLFLRFLRRPAA